jgi:molybdate transport system substrate-binding protein
MNIVSNPICRLVVLFTSALVGCGIGKSNSAKYTPPELVLAAASDLQGAFTEIGKLFEEQANCRVVFTFGSTGQLAQQIEHGAPFDVFAAASVIHIEQLESKSRVIADSKRLFARGRIVLAVNKNSSVPVTKLEDLLKPEIQHVVLANPAHAPYGVAAKQALEHEGLWDRLEPKIVLGENVRQALMYVQTGNAEAGLVALSVANVPEVTYTLIAGSWHEPLDQAITIVAGTQHEELARQFIDFINGSEGRPIMKKYGFVLPDESR